MDGYDDKDKFDKLHKTVEPWIFEQVHEMNGSVSAEHGIGSNKAKYLKFSRDNAIVNVMKSIKHTLDPNGIMNPYKVLV